MYWLPEQRALVSGDIFLGEGQSPGEIAPLLGLTANGVSAMAFRAREGLRKAFLQAHVLTGEHEFVEPLLRMAELRRALNDDPAEPRFIETIPGEGYRFIAPVHGEG